MLNIQGAQVTAESVLKRRFAIRLQQNFKSVGHPKWPPKSNQNLKQANFFYSYPFNIFSKGALAKFIFL